MRVRVDDERCGGHGTCCGLCPEVFDLSKGYAIARMSEVPEQYKGRVREAVDQCPERAIVIVE